MRKSNYFGFTLIELLVVISIIGILAAISLISFSTSQKQARDAQRKSDLKQYQTALEGYANTQTSMLYPSRTSTVVASTLCATLNIAGTCPDDPKTPTYDYNYISNGSGNPSNDAYQYILWSYLESSGEYFVICSNGKTGIETGAPSGLPCPI